MKTLFILHDHMDSEQLEQQHLLCLAMLNYDFEVQVVMQGAVLSTINASPDTQQAWRALNLYGVDEFLSLDGPSNTDWPVRVIEQADFQQLLSTADWVS
jgi:hypothetical protein